MKKTVIQFLLLCIALLCAPASVQAQNAAKKISLTVNKVPLPTALSRVEQQSGYYKINYSYDELNRYSVSASIKNKTALEAVHILIDKLPYTAAVEGKYIQIKRQARPAQQQAGAQRPKGVSGRLTDIDGEPLVGATVKVVGTQAGTITDSNGRYELADIAPDADLQFSYVGMKPLQRKAGSKPLNIILYAEDNQMDDVVVTGYQTLKRENATGAFETISSKDLDSHYTADLTSRLEGKIAGLVKYDNGNSNGLTIRGVGTLRASSQPLVVVDGLPINGNLEDVNPYDIEKITVLKDAAAAAVYGARASNGVIVVVTKKAKGERLSVDFNADMTLNNKYNYDDYGYATAAEQIELEQNNFGWITQHSDAYKNLLNSYQSEKQNLNPITVLMMQHHLGEISDSEYNNAINQWSRNSYRREWQDLTEHNRLLQQYNLALRTRGRHLNSSIIVDWKGDNTYRKGAYDNKLMLQYNGSLDPVQWLNLDFGITINNNRSRQHATVASYDYSGMTSFAEYLSMYNADGTPSTLRAAVSLDTPSLSNESLHLKSEGYVPLDEINLNWGKNRETYTRSFIHANFYPLAGLKLSGMFQYEDVSSRSEELIDGEAYPLRHFYNLFTSSGTHYFPEGGMMTVSSGEGNYYTFRAQATYDKVLADRHALSAIAGYEYRQTFSRSIYNRIFGYDEQTLTNTMGSINFDKLPYLYDSDLGSNYDPYGKFPYSNDLAHATHVKHRYGSYYVTANYTYDGRYSASASYRVDKADLFGADKKFRSRPLWSAGLGWNLHNETFMKDVSWLGLLKLRLSYGVTGNINSNYSSYLTARISTNYLTYEKMATLNTPPNDQLRWEKTRTWDAGFDFALLHHRLRGSFDVYDKKGSDLLSSIDLDPTTGWASLYTNNANTSNKGMELQVSADILHARNDRQVGIGADFTLAYNRNKITKICYTPTSGYAALRAYKEGDPVNALYSFAFDRIETDDEGYQQLFWKTADGDTKSSNLTNTAFTKEDVVFSGSLDPKWSGSFAPVITYRRFTLSGVFVFYAGHYFRANSSTWNITKYASYENTAQRSNLDYWRASEAERANMLGNGYMMHDLNISTDYLYYCDQTVDHADYMKLRNLVLGYSLPGTICRRLGMQAIRLRLQMSNVATWVRNKYNTDPEQVNPITGEKGLRAPKCYTLSLNINF